MYRWKWSTILFTAPILGGLFLTLLSGLYIVRPFTLDAEFIYFGFPIPWLEAGRSTWIPKPPTNWQYIFFWKQFTVDFTIYGLLIFATVYLYFRLRKWQT